MYERLAQRLPARGLLVSGEQLAAARWEYHLGDGEPAAVHFADGSCVDARAVHATLNVLSVVPSTATAGLRAGDVEYANAEWHALVLGWLSELGGIVLSPPCAPSLAGPMLSHAEWIAHAARAGLPTPRVRMSASRGVAVDPIDEPLCDAFVAGNEVLAPSRAPRDALVRLSRSAGAPLLHVALDARGRFVSANARPSLRLGGEPLVDLLAAAFAAELP